MDPFPVTAPLREQLELAGSEFLVDFFGREVERHPDNLHAWFELGHLFTRLVPTDPTVYYNLACSLALLSRNDEALGALERSIELGYDDADYLLNDEDLVTLRQDPQFAQLVARIK